MSAPYREAGGTPCPRCENPLLHDHPDELRCGNGCGTWLGNARVPVDPAALRGMSRGNPFRATALPFTRCPVCKLSLNDLYQGDRDVLVLGQCLEHGIWLERADLAAFEAHYARPIEAHRREVERVTAEREREAADRARRERQREREERELALVPIPDLVRQLVQRVTQLEARVAELERERKRRDD